MLQHTRPDETASHLTITLLSPTLEQFAAPLPHRSPLHLVTRLALWVELNRIFIWFIRRAAQHLAGLLAGQFAFVENNLAVDDGVVDAFSALNEALGRRGIVFRPFGRAGFDGFGSKTVTSAP